MSKRYKATFCCFTTIKTILLITFIAAVLNESSAQGVIQRYINNILLDTSDISRPQFLIYPTIAYAPETSWEIGLSTLFVYYAKMDTSNRLSEINGFTFFTLESQYGLWFDHALYTHRNQWLFLGRLRIQDFPLFYHGIGPETPEEHLALVKANQIILRQRALRQFRKNLFFGPQLNFQRSSSVNFVPRNENVPIELPPGAEGSNNLGFGLGLVYDSRHNVLNVRDGFFSELSFLRFALLSDYKFNRLFSDTRIFRPVGKHNVFAAQLLGEFNVGSVPFDQMALLGGESIMRGYYLGRYRAKNQVASQVEMRFLPLPLNFTNRIGAAAFAGIGTVFNDKPSLSVHNLVWSAGAGLRILLFPKKDIYTRLDIAFTGEGRGIYIFIGEAF